MGNCFLYKRGFGGGFGGGGGGEDIPEIEKTASGKIISITDSTENPLKGLRLFGKTTQSGTPSPTAPVPMVNVGDVGNIGVTVCGKNMFSFAWEIGDIDGGSGADSENNYIRCGYIPVIPLETYAISRTIATGYIRVRAYDANKNFFGSGGTAISIVQGYSTSNPMHVGEYECVIKIKAGVSYLRFVDESGDLSTLYQMEHGSTVTEYEPYKGQILTLQTPNGLPGVHVSEGGNYTDENGWQWICDEMDFARGKYIQRVLRIASYNGETIPGAYMSSTGALTTGATVLHALTSPVETDLTAEQLAAYAALHTLSPSTTLYNDADSYMEVKYMAKGG